MEANKENRTARMAALNEKFKEKVGSQCGTSVDLCNVFKNNVILIFLTGQEARRSEKEQGGNERTRKLIIPLRSTTQSLRLQR